MYHNEPELILHTETIINEQSINTPYRHFGIKPAYNVLDDNGVILTFRFLAATKFENSNALPFSVQQNQLTTALKFSHPYGVILQSKEKTAVYPVLQLCCGNNDNSTKDEDYLIQGYSIQSSLYKEVRQIESETEDNSDYRLNTFYIILGFKTVDTQAVLDSWKDWTGARYIYINFPDQLNLRKIKLYRKENSEHVSLFNYVVMVECDGVNSKEKQTILLDFVQRLRAERTSNFCSVYEEVIT